MKSPQKNELAEFGKVPPQAVDLEEAVLGAIMLEAGTFSKVSFLLNDKEFYKDSHQKIFRAAAELEKNNQPIDLLTVTNQLKTTGELEQVGGPYYITMLTSRIAGSGNVEFHAAIIKQKSILRQLIAIGSDIQKQAFEDTIDCFDLVQQTQDRVSILTGFDRGTIRHISEGLQQIQNQIHKNLTNENKLTGIPSGFKEFDNHSNGFQNGDLVIVAGETSQGKTSLTLNIALHAAKQKFKLALYSYEMSEMQLTARLLATETNISSKQIMMSRLGTDDLGKIDIGIQELIEKQIFLDELQSSKYSYLERSIKTMVQREGIQMAVVDYLQLIKSDTHKDKVTAIAEIANDLKSLARTLKIPILLVSQLTRDKMNPKPTMGRLKGSGDIENAADIIWLTWQPDHYGNGDFECQGNIIPAAGNSQQIIAKGRNIGLLEFPLAFNRWLTTFTEYIPSETKTNEYPDY